MPAPARCSFKCIVAESLRDGPAYRERHFSGANLPLVLGHEFSGAVASIGDGVADISVGDRVAVDINISCGHCYLCGRGQKLFCPRVAQLGVHRAGGLAEYVTAGGGRHDGRG